jgi:hypothetical protein
VSDARRLVIVLVVAAAIVGLLPGVIARSHRVQVMRAGLTEVVAECRARYAGAHTAADTTAADAWQPPLHGERRPGDPACGAYRRRNMLGLGAAQ